MLPVHAVTFAAVVGGALLVFTGDRWAARFLGVVLLLLFFATKPSVPGLPEHSSRLTRSEAPTFFGFLDAVAAVSGAPVPDEVLVSDEVNAGAMRVGWRRGPVLEIGAPLWVAAPPQARVALVGHELGHFAHGDLTHGWWVGAAQETLLHWLDIAGGTRHVTSAHVYVVQRFLMAPLRGLTLGHLYLTVWLEAPGSQRQEYLADLDAARAAGTDGAVAMLDVTISEHTIEAIDAELAPALTLAAKEAGERIRYQR